MSRACAEVNLAAVGHNLDRVRELAGSAEVMAVVKADGYGHGMVPMAREARAQGVPWLGVALPTEALALRASGDRGRILAWLWTPGEPAVEACVAAGVDLSVSSRWALDEVVAAARSTGRPSEHPGEARHRAVPQRPLARGLARAHPGSSCCRRRRGRRAGGDLVAPRRRGPAWGRHRVQRPRPVHGRRGGCPRGWPHAPPPAPQQQRWPVGFPRLPLRPRSRGHRDVWTDAGRQSRLGGRTRAGSRDDLACPAGTREVGRARHERVVRQHVDDADCDEPRSRAAWLRGRRAPSSRRPRRGGRRWTSVPGRGPLGDGPVRRRSGVSDVTRRQATRSTCSDRARTGS